MSENSNTPTEARSPNPHQMYYRYRSVDENTMKKIVVIGGSIMLLILFALIFAVNMQNKNWNDSEKVIGFCISIAGLLIFSSILVSYSIHQLKKSAQRRRLVNSSANINVEANDENQLPPPSYEEIMGKLPSYDSYSKSTAKNITNNNDQTENTHHICHV